MREVAGEPEELELEREHERIHRWARRRGFQRVRQVEEARQGTEGPLVRLLLGEEPEHRLGGDEADPQPVRVLARLPVRVDQLGARDRLELAASLVQDQLAVAQRFQPGAEARFRLTHAFRDRSHPAAVERVEVQHAIGLAQPERAQDDGLGLVRAPGHWHQV